MIMRVIDARKLFEARRAEVAKERKPEGRVLAEGLTNAASIAPKETRKDDALDAMVERLSGDADELHKKSALLHRFAEDTLKFLEKLLRKDVKGDREK